MEIPYIVSGSSQTAGATSLTDALQAIIDELVTEIDVATVQNILRDNNVKFE